MISTNKTNTINSTGPNGEVVKLTLNDKKEVIKAEQIKPDNTATVLATDNQIFTKAVENANANSATRRALGLTQSSQNIKASPTYNKSNETALKTNGNDSTLDFNAIKTAVTGGLANIPGVGDINLEKLGGEYKPIFNETLIYPIDLAKDQDRMQITMYRYRTPFVTAPTTVSAADKPRTPEEVLGAIILPMPSQLKDVSEIEWSPKTLSNLEIASGVLEAIGGVANQFKKDNKPVDAKTQSLLTQEETYSRFAGVISNPNQDLLFSGIGLRQFPYEFNLIPRNEAETLVIRKIVRTFRQGMLPRKLLGGAIVGAPNTFRIKFINGRTGKPLKDVRRHKELALVNFVAYPMLTDSWMTYDDEEHSALGFKIQMVFQELTPIYYDDYEGKDINGDSIDENDNISVGY